MIMAVMVREAWTDERLDDLNDKVDRGFADLKAEMRDGFNRMEAMMDARFAKVDERFVQVDARFEKMDDRFYALNRMLIGSAVTIIAALLGILATQL